MCAAVDTLTAPHSAFNWTRAAETADGIPTAQGVSVPWEECHGVSVTRNAPLLRLFAARVLAVLAQKPGSRLSGLHVALEVLSFAQVRRLLHEMVALGWVVQRRPVVSARLCGPFAPAVGSSERIAEAESVYFVGQF